MIAPCDLREMPASSRQPSSRRLYQAVLLWIMLVLSSSACVAEPVIKAGVLKFGTVNWLLDVVEHNKLDEKQGYRLEQVEFARRDATSVALLAGSVDTIVADWFFALRERSEGEPLVFFPYSLTLGALIR